MKNFQSFQLTMPQISVWRIESSKDVAEALALLQHGYHTFYASSRRLDDKDHYLVKGEHLILEDDTIYEDHSSPGFAFSPKSQCLGIGNAVITSTNGKGYIHRYLPEDYDGTNLPEFLWAPHLNPLG